MGGTTSGRLPSGQYGSQVSSMIGGVYMNNANQYAVRVTVERVAETVVREEVVGAGFGVPGKDAWLHGYDLFPYGYRRGQRVEVAIRPLPE